jgi:large subunit ribosomal protein L10
MSKVIKQLQMDALKKDFGGVRDLVFLSVSKLNAGLTHNLRMSMRKKNVRLQVIKNSLARRVFRELGLNIKDDSPYWLGPTVLAFGAGSVSELSRTLDDELKSPKLVAGYKDKVVIKGAVADGQEVTFEIAKKMPTKAEALGRVVMLALSPAAKIAGALKGPAGRVAGQVKTLSERKPEGEGAPAA